MSNKKNLKTEKENTFSYKDEEDNIVLKKFNRRKWILFGVGVLTILSLIILGSVFFTNRATFVFIFSFYCAYLWTLPLLCVNIRAHYFSKHKKNEQKKGRIFMVFGFYFLFLWIASLSSLLMYLGGLNISWVSDVLFWVSTCVFIPYLLFILITKF
jgi:MFS family permease